MRKRLKKISSKTRSHTFIGTLAKCNGDRGFHKHFLLENIYDAGNGKYMTNHVWLSTKKRWSKVLQQAKPGDRIKFKCVVQRYVCTNGKVNYGCHQITDVEILGKD